MTKLRELKKRLMDDPEFREEYARVDNEYALVEALVSARTAAKLTQAEVARRLGTTQSAVARLEGGRVSPSFVTLRRYAEATGTRLIIGLMPVDGWECLITCVSARWACRGSRAQLAEPGNRSSNRIANCPIAAVQSIGRFQRIPAFRIAR